MRDPLRPRPARAHPGRRSPAGRRRQGATAWRRIHGEGYGSDYLTRAAMQGFQWHHQRELLLPYREPFFERVRGIFGRATGPGFARAYLGALFPAAWAEPEVLERPQRLLADLGAGRGPARRHLLELCDDLERIIRVRAYAEAADRIAKAGGDVRLPLRRRCGDPAADESGMRYLYWASMSMKQPSGVVGLLVGLAHLQVGLEQQLVGCRPSHSAGRSWWST